MMGTWKFLDFCRGLPREAFGTLLNPGPGTGLSPALCFLVYSGVKDAKKAIFDKII